MAKKKSQAIQKAASHTVAGTGQNPDRKRCGAKLRGPRAGRTCQTWAMPNGRCRMHGGNAAIGESNGNFKHGRYSRVLPQGLIETYQAAQNDPDLHNLVDEIQLVDVRIRTLLATVDGGVGKASDVLAALSEFQTAGQAGRVEQAQAAMARAIAVLQPMASAEGTWGNLERAIDQRRKLVESDTKRRQILGQMLPIERILVFARALGNSVRVHVTDPEVRAKIQRDMQTFGVPV